MRNLTLSLLSVVLIATIGLGWMFDNIYNRYAQTQINEPKDSIAILEQVGQNIATAINGLDNRQRFINNWPSDAQFQLTIVPLALLPMPEELINNLKSGLPLSLETDDNIAIYYYLHSHNDLLRLSAVQLNAIQPDAQLNLLFTSLFYLAVLLLMFIWIYPLARRLLALRKTAKLFGEGKLEQRIEVGSISYIRDLELEFNHMAQRIESLVSDVKLLSSAVSHDLRTPLARIRFGIDTLQEEDDPVLRKRFEQRISDNVDEMVELVETLLNYARLDQAMLALNKSSTDFSALISHSIKNKWVASIEINYTPPVEPIYVYGDPAYLSILLSNLIQNASQYCHSKIIIELKEQQNSVILVITDDGPGIDLAQREQIVKPFIRGQHLQKNNSSNPSSNHASNKKGYGIGLAIVKRIVEWHQGQMAIDNSPILHGAQFTITLPKKT